MLGETYKSTKKKVLHYSSFLILVYESARSVLVKIRKKVRMGSNCVHSNTEIAIFLGRPFPKATFTLQ